MKNVQGRQSAEKAVATRPFSASPSPARAGTTTIAATTVGKDISAERGTRARVARLILEHGPVTAAALGERLGLTPAAVRRHLDALLADGMIEPRTARPRGQRGRGRPAKMFAITDAGRSAFVHAYDDLAGSALRFLAERLGGEAVSEFAQAQVSGLVGRLETLMREVPAEQRVRVLAEALSTEGYAASATATGKGGEQLCQHHCPVAHVAAAFPQLCEAETEAFARLLGTPVQRLATIANGDGVCTTHVSSPALAARHARADPSGLPGPPTPAAHIPTAHISSTSTSKESGR
ncbi:helix-turn-helix transcriptional regulator [Microbispora amethystogenes]|uniref:helix-turn-helix transcriptional regulator n=1 Tax=Microbispora amethystogenes TaxID=1427754 RepID=UPI001EF37F83|nr:metalloregulator ArsR/SmtB family transcription factor [Microbispora amethystogenes]